MLAAILHLRKWEVGIQATVILACAEAGIPAHLHGIWNGEGWR